VSGFYDLTHSIRQADFQFRKEKKNLKKSGFIFLFTKAPNSNWSRKQILFFLLFFDSKIFIPFAFYIKK
jgi:hypothetical protein